MESNYEHRGNRADSCGYYRKNVQLSAFILDCEWLWAGLRVVIWLLKVLFLTSQGLQVRWAVDFEKACPQPPTGLSSIPSLNGFPKPIMEQTWALRWPLKHTDTLTQIKKRGFLTDESFIGSDPALEPGLGAWQAELSWILVLTWLFSHTLLPNTAWTRCVLPWPYPSLGLHWAAPSI